MTCEDYFELMNLVADNEEIKKLKAKLSKYEVNNKLIEYCKSMKEVLDNYPIINDNSLFFDKIVFNYLHVIDLYFVQKKQKKPKCSDTIDNFFNTAIRILEFAIFIKHNDISDFEEIYFNTENVNSCFFKHFISIKDYIEKFYKDRFYISKDIENRFKVTIFLGHDFKYIPTSIPRSPFGNNNYSVDWFERYFKLSDKEADIQIHEVFSGKGSKTSNNIHGDRRSKEARNGSFDTNKEIEDTAVSSIGDMNLESYDERYESNSRQNENKSILLVKQEDMDDTLLEDENIKEISKLTKLKKLSNYKNIQIGKFISSSIAKKEMFLESKAPNLEILSELVKNILNGNNWHEYVISVAIFTGIKIENLFLALIDYPIIDKLVDIEISDQSIIFYIDKTSFAQNIIIDEQIVKEVDNEKFIVFLPDFLFKMTKFIKEELEILIKAKREKGKSLDSSFFENLLKEELKNIKNVFKDNIDKLSKNVSNLNINNIHRVFYYYFHKFSDKTDIGILTNKLSKTDEVKVRYTIRLQRLHIFEDWINKLYQKLTNNHSTSKSYDISKIKYSGSPKYVENIVFRAFLISLKSLKLDDEIQRFNILMIIIRYSLSILLATREYRHSCNLSNYSQKYSILLIHEKAKDINSSKRLIPLTKRAKEYIELFYKLKEKYNIKSKMPILLIDNSGVLEEKDMSRKSILDFLQKSFKNHRLTSIEQFVKGSDLNLGRHVFSTEAINYSFNKEFTNEFLGHYSKAQLGFGMYSNFDVKKYIDETRAFMEKIEDDFFPKEISIEDLI